MRCGQEEQSWPGKKRAVGGRWSPAKIHCDHNADAVCLLCFHPSVALFTHKDAGSTSIQSHPTADKATLTPCALPSHRRRRAGSEGARVCRVTGLGEHDLIVPIVFRSMRS
jgi:hypothetical protein